jgi:hypothetical protein
MFYLGVVFITKIWFDTNRTSLHNADTVLQDSKKAPKTHGEKERAPHS